MRTGTSRYLGNDVLVEIGRSTLLRLQQQSLLFTVPIGTSVLSTWASPLRSYNHHFLSPLRLSVLVVHKYPR